MTKEEKIAAYKKSWYETHKEERKAHHRALKQTILDHYGNICVCPGCGETRFEFLSIDHINGGGTKHRKEIGKLLYRWLIDNNFPEGFQILCMNCNSSKGYYGYCPHEKEH